MAGNFTVSRLLAQHVTRSWNMDRLIKSNLAGIADLIVCEVLLIGGTYFYGPRETGAGTSVSEMLTVSTSWSSYFAPRPSVVWIVGIGAFTAGFYLSAWLNNIL
jgi:hypothetical protein